MTLDEATTNYILNDGQIISCSIKFEDEPTAVIVLKVREISSNKQVNAYIELIFGNLIEIYLFEDFTEEYYSDITLLQMNTGEYYLSLDPYGNSNEPNEKDNFIIKAKTLEIASHIPI
jgi:hypothetical protein